MASPQTYKNHRQFVPPFHIGVLLSLLVNFGWASYRLVQNVSVDNAVSLLLAATLILLALFARAFPIRAQDRLIRLEMRLRMKDVLPMELQPRIKDFTTGQLVALRFASDAELPGLAATVLKDGIVNQNTIKKMIQDWQPDTLRV